ncbi:MAG: carbohydrate kinase family protein [Candidatus Micrarchaeota archaeon]
MIYVAGLIAYDYLFSVDSLPSPNASCYIKNYERYFGGAVGNTAYACSRLGVKTSLISIVGRDFSGSEYEKHLKKNNVGMEHVHVIRNKKTPRAYMYIGPSGDFLSFFHWGAGEDFNRMKVPKLKLTDGDIIHITTGDPEFNMRLSEYGGISFDPSYDTPLYNKTQLRRILKNTKFLFCNRHEMNRINDILDNCSPLDYGVEAIVMSEGSGGTVVKTSEKSIRVPAVNATVVDTIGAGDSHHAGFLCAYLRGETFKRCAQIASAVASFVIEERGAQTNVPTWRKALSRL